MQNYWSNQLLNGFLYKQYSHVLNDNAFNVEKFTLGTRANNLINIETISVQCVEYLLKLTSFEIK